nr:DNA-directed RNA polymerase subunit omega [Clostridia bacterium]
MINKPSVEEMTTDELNRYELVIATAKCARLITDEYVEQRATAEKLVERKETDKPISALIDKDLRDEKAVRNAVERLKDGQYKIVRD